MEQDYILNKATDKLDTILYTFFVIVYPCFMDGQLQIVRCKLLLQICKYTAHDNISGVDLL